MMNNTNPPQRTLTGSSINQQQDDLEEGESLIREIHDLSPVRPNTSSGLSRRREPWETSSHVSANSMSMASEGFTSMSREFNALVVAGSAIENDISTEEHHHHHPDDNNHNRNNNMLLAMIGEDRDQVPEETNPLAIVHQHDISSNMPPVASPGRTVSVGPAADGGSSSGHGEISVQRVKKDEAEWKITAWQNAKVAKINNRFKREDAIICGWENGQVEKASSEMKKVERKLEEKRARALEKMQNDIAKARRKAEDKRASAEAKRGTEVAKVYEICNLMRAVGRAPSKRSFF